MKNQLLVQIKEDTLNLIKEFLDKVHLDEEEIIIIGCSTSEVTGNRIGTNSSPEVAQIIFETLYTILKDRNLNIAIQCCEHLNRAIVIEKKIAKRERLEIVNAVPQYKAGGSFATIAFENLEEPVVVEEIVASAGIDIGDTLIGMHLKKVAVPLRLSIKQVGYAHVVCARTRPKFIGGERAVYNKELL